MSETAPSSRSVSVAVVNATSTMFGVHWLLGHVGVGGNSFWLRRAASRCASRHLVRTRPLPEATADSGAPLHAPPAISLASERAMHHATRILVVDSEANERGPVTNALRAAGYETATCSTAADAVRASASFRPDLVILEMLLRGQVDGAALARRLRAERNPLLMFVTRDGSVAGRMAAFQAGADDYVVKPYLIDELLARVRALLRRTGRTASQVSQVGRLVVDEPAHRVMVGDTIVDLGPTDFALLAMLARHAGQVLSKSRLLELVWGYEAVDENLVEVHVSILRRRLGKEADLIHTVRGVGYVLRDSNPDELQDP
jgi:two-component system OmpR family response regulator